MMIGHMTDVFLCREDEAEHQRPKKQNAEPADDQHRDDGVGVDEGLLTGPPPGGAWGGTGGASIPAGGSGRD